MTIKDLIILYEKKRKRFGKDAPNHITSLLNEAKKVHKKDFLQSSTAKKAIAKGR